LNERMKGGACGGGGMELRQHEVGKRHALVAARLAQRAAGQAGNLAKAPQSRRARHWLGEPGLATEKRMKRLERARRKLTSPTASHRSRSSCSDHHLYARGLGSSCAAEPGSGGDEQGCEGSSPQVGRPATGGGP
jgi:hypothetical protein